VSTVKVRFAPSPTGELHIGGARTALFNYLYARANEGILVLRIDDTDLERSKALFSQQLLEALQWLGLSWDEGPYYQSERIQIYFKEAERLLCEGKAYRCFCSIESLEKSREKARNEGSGYLYPGTCRDLSVEQIESLSDKNIEPVIRLKSPDSGETIVHDEIRGEVIFDNTKLDDFIIIKSNGLPTYNFASIVDDVQMEISHIIRAEEHLTNTPLQILCANALGYQSPIFVHAPMILAPDRSKLSKRHGATSVEEFRNAGILSEALINYIALLGWSPGGDRELLKMDELINSFSIKKITKTAAIYDTDKMYWMNSHYLRSYDLDALSDVALPYFEEKGFIKKPLTVEERLYLTNVINLSRERAKTIKDLAASSAYFFEEHFDYDEKTYAKVLLKTEAPQLLEDAAALLLSADFSDAQTIETIFKDMIAEKGVSAGQLVQPARLALTGQPVGPAIYEIMLLLGKDKTVKRLKKLAGKILNQS